MAPDPVTADLFHLHPEVYCVSCHILAEYARIYPVSLARKRHCGCRSYCIGWFYWRFL
jgi:hypothetical protein